MAHTSPPTALLRLRVEIVGSDPEIWRLLEVDAGLTLAEMHDVLQVAFGWRMSHLHLFTDQDPFAPRHNLPKIGQKLRVWGPNDPFGEADDDQLSEQDWTLDHVFDGFDGPLYYEYDFGDSWIHRIELVERSNGDRDAPKARLLGGERSGPLEDSGGIGGYRDKLGILADENHPEHEQIASWVEWVSGPWNPFDPEHLDVPHVNGELAVRFTPDLGMSGLPTDAFPGSPKPAEQLAGTVNAAPLLPADAAIIDLIERLPVPLRGELRALLARTSALDAPDIDEERAAAMVEPFLWLVRRAGTDGILLSKAGWMPAAVVFDAMHELGWARSWYGQMKRESQTAPIRLLREDAAWLGLLRKRNGVLYATATARGFLDDPLGLWRMLAARMLSRARSDAERDITTLVALDVATGHYPKTDAGFGYEMPGIVFGLSALGWGNADGSPLEAGSIARLVHDVQNTLDRFGAFERERALRARATDGGRAFARQILRSPLE